MGKDLEARLAEATATAAEQLSDLHTWHKTVQADIREAREVAEKVAQLATEAAMETAIAPLIQTGLAELSAQIDKVKETIDHGLETRFEKLANVMLYGNEQGRGDSIVDERIHEWLTGLVRLEIPRAMEAVVLPIAEKVTRHCFVEAAHYLETMQAVEGNAPIRIDITIPPEVVAVAVPAGFPERRCAACSQTIPAGDNAPQRGECERSIDGFHIVEAPDRPGDPI